MEKMRRKKVKREEERDMNRMLAVESSLCARKMVLIEFGPKLSGFMRTAEMLCPGGLSPRLKGRSSSVF